jgi:hypothetical protein
LFDGDDDGLLKFNEFASAVRALYLLSLQFSEKQRRQVHKSSLALLLEKYQAKQSGAAAASTTTDTTPTLSTPIDDLSSDWTYLSLSEQFERTFSFDQLATMFSNNSSQTQMDLHGFQNAFQVQQYFDQTISDNPIIVD